MTGAMYVEAVIDHIPPALALREQVALELRGHIDERLSDGRPIEEVLHQLGDPLTLAESYLSAVPLRPASARARLIAKGIDVAMVAVPAAVAAALLWIVLPDALRVFLPLFACLAAIVAFVVFTVIGEHTTGQTFGKRVMRLRVVRESGARIGLGQAVLRQVPFFAQFFWIDALFALFTDRRQRAFELLTKTRVVACGR